MPAKFAYTLDSGVVGKLEYETFNAARAVVTIHGTSVHPGQAKDVMVNALAEAAKLFARMPGRWSARTAWKWVRRLLYVIKKQSGDIGKVELEYIIRDHSMEKFEEKSAVPTNRRCAKCNVWCLLVSNVRFTMSTYNMYEIYKDDMTSVEVAVRLIKNVVSRQIFNHSVEEQMDVLLLIKEFQLQTYLPELRTSMGNEFVTLESMQKQVMWYWR